MLIFNPIFDSIFNSWLATISAPPAFTSMLRSRRAQASPLEASQVNYLGNVLRLKAGDSVLVFNGRDGEWRATLASAGKRAARAQHRAGAPGAQTGAPDLHYLFAPLKHARLDYMVQKAVEMGASRLQPVITRHAQVARVNLERMRANAIEAAEQCGILTLPEIGAPLSWSG